MYLCFCFFPLSYIWKCVLKRFYVFLHAVEKCSSFTQAVETTLALFSISDKIIILSLQVMMIMHTWFYTQNKNKHFLRKAAQAKVIMVLRKKIGIVSSQNWQMRLCISNWSK